MSSLYAMRRANGDWFALDDRGGFRVPVFRSIRDGVLACVSHTGMLLFRPAALDEVALSDFRPASGEGAVHFWLVDAPFAGLKRGRRVDCAQLAALLRD
jgi:hypothetical protein